MILFQTRHVMRKDTLVHELYLTSNNIYSYHGSRIYINIQNGNMIRLRNVIIIQLYIFSQTTRRTSWL